jgi:hypothetical protein
MLIGLYKGVGAREPGAAAGVMPEIAFVSDQAGLRQYDGDISTKGLALRIARARECENRARNNRDSRRSGP